MMRHTPIAGEYVCTGCMLDIERRDPVSVFWPHVEHMRKLCVACGTPIPNGMMAWELLNPPIGKLVKEALAL